MLKLLCFLAVVGCASALDNGLARTPPMGWMSWERFMCNIDCKKDPDNCLSEKLFMQMADHMAADGYKDVGYEYISIDDCWALHDRDPVTNNLVADPDRFPSGIKALADYVHSKGLKLGIYGDMGRLTCMGYPGSEFTMEQDANLYASWGVDALKFDGCYGKPDDFPTAYPQMGYYLNKTGRPIMYSCSWPAYLENTPDKIPWDLVSKSCNIWRNFGDIYDDWGAIKSIIGSFAGDPNNISSVAGPGHFNDPDMIVVGNTGLSYNEEKVQMAMWAMLAAPLYLSADLRNIRPESRDLLIHKGVIAIDQDPLGIAAKKVWEDPNTHIQAWTRPVTPAGSYALAVLNELNSGYFSHLTLTFKDLGITLGDKPLQMTEIFSGKDMGVYHSDSMLNITVDTNSVFFAKLTPSS